MESKKWKNSMYTDISEEKILLVWKEYQLFEVKSERTSKQYEHTNKRASV